MIESSRSGGGHDKIVVENFLNLLKRKRIRRKTWRSRAKARQDAFN